MIAVVAEDGGEGVRTTTPSMTTMMTRGERSDVASSSSTNSKRENLQFVNIIVKLVFI